MTWPLSNPDDNHVENPGDNQYGSPDNNQYNSPNENLDEKKKEPLPIFFNSGTTENKIAWRAQCTYCNIKEMLFSEKYTVRT